MTATLMPVERVDAESLTTTLTRSHDQWMERIARVLAPATFPHASFWDRWGAVRFLADEYEIHFRMESELVESLGDRLTPSARARLTAAARAVGQTRAELIAAGRRRGTGPEVALLARRFLDQARRWCATLEMATATLSASELSAWSRAILARLEERTRLEL